MLRTLSRLHPPLRLLSHSLHTRSPSFANRARNPEIPRSPSPHTSPFSSSRKRKGGDEVREEAKDEVDVVPGALDLGRDLQSRPRLFVVQPRLRPDSLLNSKLSEALNLAKSLEEQRDGFVQRDFASEKIIPHLVVQNPSARSSKSHADTYFGPGTVDNIKTHMKALESEDQIDAVFVNGTLSGIQQRNLEISWEKPVLDRVGLIIGIFNAHAETKEAKLQSELAALMYKRSRLVRLRGSHGRLTFGMNGESEVVSGRGRGSGGRGSMSGAGETELQLQRRRIQDQRNQLLVQIDEVRRTRALQRSARKRYGGSDGQGLATIAVVGYTNAGKSTLVSALSNSKLYMDDRLFATVDPCLRSVVLPSGRKVLLSDTVGFISDLPVQLVEAFHATLEEVVEADMLMHVLDSSATNFDEQRSSVLEVLQQIGVSEEKVQNMIEVWNKIDLLNKKDGTTAQDEAREGKEAKKCRTTLQDPKEEDEAQLKNDAGEDGVLTESQGNLESDQFFGVHLKENVLSSGHDAASRVEVSAITGVGLKELLLLISKKLDAQKLVVQRSYEPLDRKWRPAHDMESDRAAEH